MQTPEANNEEKFKILINTLGLNSYEYVDSAKNYTDAIEKLEKVYNKKNQPDLYKIEAIARETKRR